MLTEEEGVVSGHVGVDGIAFVKRADVVKGALQDASRWFAVAVKHCENSGTVSKATLGELLTDGVERLWVFPRAEILS